jgi:hypothetical protein
MTLVRDLLETLELINIPALKPLLLYLVILTRNVTTPRTKNEYFWFPTEQQTELLYSVTNPEDQKRLESSKRCSEPFLSGLTTVPLPPIKPASLCLSRTQRGELKLIPADSEFSIEGGALLMSQEKKLENRTRQEKCYVRVH